MSTLNLTQLQQYVNELSGILLKESILAGNTFKYISIQTGIKYADVINTLTSNLVVKAGGCGPISPQGTVTLSQREIKVCPMMVEESICVDEFEKYWIGQLAKTGSYNTSAPEEFNKLYVANKVEKISQFMEDLFWKGSTSGTYGGGNLELCDGILHILENTSASTQVTSITTTGPLTVANAMSVIDDMIAAIPNDVLDSDDLTIFLSYANYRTLMNALRNANYFVTYDGQKHTWVLENYTNTNVRVVATRGLIGRNEIVLTPSSNLFLGVDAIDDPESFQFWYEKKDNMVYFRAKFKMGAQVAFPQYVVIKND